MTNVEHPTVEGDARVRGTRRDWWLVLECLAGLGVLVICGALFIGYLSIYLTFWGEPPREETARDITRYWTQVGIGAALLLTMYVAAWNHRRGLILESLFAVILVASAVLFQMNGAEPTAPAESPEPTLPAVSCHSGGDSSGCPGG
jgi:hypothetical protein